MMLAAEQVHKILSEIFKGDGLALSYAVSKLLSWLTKLVAVQRGILVKNDSIYYRQVQETVGLYSEWISYHRLAAGVDTASGDDRAVKTRGIAGLCLYRETVAVLRTAMRADHLQIAERAVQIVDKSGVVTLI